MVPLLKEMYFEYKKNKDNSENIENTENNELEIFDRTKLLLTKYIAKDNVGKAIEFLEENEPEEDSDDTDFSSTAIFIPTDINNGDDE